MRDYQKMNFFENKIIAISNILVKSTDDYLGILIKDR